MPGTPIADITLLFTDIVGSTGLHVRSPDGAPRVIERHFRLIEGAVAAEGGHAFKRVGDQVCAEFDEPLAAVRAALRAQAALAAETWSRLAPEIDRLEVRMAVHRGSAHRFGSEIHGVSLSIVARMLDSASGRQIVLSEPVARAAEGAPLPDGTSIVSLGQIVPRGVGPVSIFGLMRRLEIDLAVAGLHGGDGHLTYYLPLNGYRADQDPAEWVTRRWVARNPGLPGVEDLQRQGRVGRAQRDAQAKRGSLPCIDRPVAGIPGRPSGPPGVRAPPETR